MKLPFLAPSAEIAEVSDALIEFAIPCHEAQFPVSEIFRADGMLDDKNLLSRNYLFNFRATFSPANNRISARSENSTDWKSALTLKYLLFLVFARLVKMSNVIF